ncbi:MAG: hypothetical protein JNJ76_10830 [Candidatus Competibacter sp.]|nr:hypothetical protein [Candidatus Competibacter sp.]
MVVAVPHEQKLGNNFGFKKNSIIERFEIKIFERGANAKKASILFLEVKVGEITPIIHKNLTISGVEMPFEKLSVDNVFMTVNRNNIHVS